MSEMSELFEIAVFRGPSLQNMSELLEKGSFVAICMPECLELLEIAVFRGHQYAGVPLSYKDVVTHGIPFILHTRVRLHEGDPSHTGALA